MAKSEKFSLKLLIDDEKNKVVLAEACHDFVDVIFGLLTFPLGTSARLLEKHKKSSQVLGCYKNLSRSVSNMAIDDFETEACKSMLLHPKSTKEIYCRRLKLNIDDTPPTKFFVCPNLYRGDSCSNAYSIFNTSRCSCGALMSVLVRIPEDNQVIGAIGNAVDGVFVNCRSSFIVTDDLTVKLNSIDEIVKVVNGLGYTSLSGLREMIVDVGSEEVLWFSVFVIFFSVGNLFTSESPLTCTFLKKQCMTMTLNLPLPSMLKTRRLEQGRGCYVKLFVGKLDMKILYAECSEDFIDSLLTFLVIPLELASSFSSDNTVMGCVSNSCRGGCRRDLTYNSALHDYYTCSSSLFDIQSCPSPAYECLIPDKCYSCSRCIFARRIERSVISKGEKVVILKPMNPKSSRSETPLIFANEVVFVKRKTKFIVSDDMIITPMNSFLTIGFLKNMQINVSDLESQSISIYKAELINILRASLTSSSALTNGLSYLLAKEPKE